MRGAVAAVHSSAAHAFSKMSRDVVRLLAGLGVEDDAHMGVTVKHRSRVAKDPAQPNLRQVHLIHSELFSELAAQGFNVTPGQLGENLTTNGINLLGLPQGTRLHVGASAVIEVTGLRNPCYQIDRFQQGLTKALVSRNGDGRVSRKAGIMSIVLASGEVRPGDSIQVELPAPPHRLLECV
jgi:MOSC domain-containing protein YiiM